MNKLRFVSPLTDSQRAALKSAMKNTIIPQRAKTRMHAILLSDRKFSVKQICDIYQVTRNTLSAWIKAWEQYGLTGLFDAPRENGKYKSSDEEQEILRREIQENPRSLKDVAEKFKKLTGKSLSRQSIRRQAKKFRLKWKRIRKSLKSKRNQEKFEKAKQDINAFKELKEKGETDVVYFDGAGFSLTPCVSYAWQPAGRDNTIEIPSACGKGINILSFLSAGNELTSYLFDKTINSSAVSACFDDFAGRITKPVAVILDNASMHTGREFYGKIEGWQEKGLFPYFIPAYSPELNLIEILWKKMKYEWIPFSAYENTEKLKNAIETILIEYGSKYIIDFA